MSSLAGFPRHLDAVLARGRAAAQSRNTSTATIRRRGARAAQNEIGGLQGYVWDDVHVDVSFRLDGGSSGDGGSRTVTIAGTEFEQATGVGHLPFDLVDLEDSDLIKITAGEWAGTVWRVVEAVKADQKTSRRVPVVQVDPPEEWSA